MSPTISFALVTLVFHSSYREEKNFRNRSLTPMDLPEYRRKERQKYCSFSFDIYTFDVFQINHKNVMFNNSDSRLTLTFYTSQQNLEMNHYLLLVFQVHFCLNFFIQKSLNCKKGFRIFGAGCRIKMRDFADHYFSPSIFFCRFSYKSFCQFSINVKVKFFSI